MAFSTASRELPGARPATRLHAVPAADRAVVRVAVLADDVFLRAGLLSEIQGKPGIHVVAGSPASADVVVAITESATELPALVADAPTNARLVLITGAPRPAELWTAIEQGLVVLIPRAELTTARVLRAIADAHQGHGHLPAELLGQVLHGLARLQRDVLAPRELMLNGLSRRETEVLRRLADGQDTAEIAAEMSYSERTVKNILHNLTSRLGLRNRTHAVSYALRNGLI
ncbi:helix-turn-helix transcriptional regulator [Amycolatopsis thermophila]|uniref:DNA-binding NarL/FixJ family response regulator n=1 Tax=Amycolatopsis thermophila TaxID=206084 RepID=A0ABU0EMT0_9PSEU|nr:response regulator transcription factor [Amycolatopsis thermophila]MDQ0376132.1 DNA-binding NarL/FixJ family response regulator [Amycolatopsis thermophila]